MDTDLTDSEFPVSKTGVVCRMFSSQPLLSEHGMAVKMLCGDGNSMTGILWDLVFLENNMT